MADTSKRASGVMHIPGTSSRRRSQAKKGVTPQTRPSGGPVSAPGTVIHPLGASTGNRQPITGSRGSDAEPIQDRIHSSTILAPPQFEPSEFVPLAEKCHSQRLSGVVRPLVQSNSIAGGPRTTSHAGLIIPQLFNPSVFSHRTQYMRSAQHVVYRPNACPSGPSPVIASMSAPRRAAVFAASTLGAAYLPYVSTNSATLAYSTDLQAGIRFQQLQREAGGRNAPSESKSLSSSSIKGLGSSPDLSACESPKFVAAVSHGRTATTDFSPPPSDGIPSTPESQQSFANQSNRASLACCGMDLQPVSICQLFLCSSSPPAKPALPAKQANCHSAIQQLQNAEDEATYLVLAAQDRASALRAQARAQAETEGQRLRSSMEASLEAIAEKHKREHEADRQVCSQEEAEVGGILERDKSANLPRTVAMIVDLVLNVDVQCPIEAIKLFCYPEKLLAFKERAAFLHHPSGELLLRTEDHITWDQEGRALLERDALRHRHSFGSFWTRHQSRVHASDRPAVLVKTPSFVDPLDRDMNRRLPTLWEPQGTTEFVSFKLPDFALSSPSCSPSESESPALSVSEQVGPLEGAIQGTATPDVLPTNGATTSPNAGRVSKLGSGATE
ncbi:hypothetical protein cyc_07154 [Cyclospora cayetanensis]|uniref:Uncharacterized protein n=1 Tax=Cyclospora cayetanensis TaxID=88456 RepID=A0A1D3CTY1_9EIME|nr:hypothetical protein cyc_07154 [Cyclospora cayetanensis]